VLPGFDGGGEWGGAAVDTAGVLYVNASDVPWIAAMREAAQLGPRNGPVRKGPAVYAAVCARCHGSERQGHGRALPLIDLPARLSADDVRQIIERGRGFMPSFAGLPETEKRAVIQFLGFTLPPSTDTVSSQPSRGSPSLSPYEFVGYERWRDSSDLPAIRPPWGTLSAIDLNTGEYRWRIPLGQHPAVKAGSGLPSGTEQYGGPIVTAGGLVFIAATMDGKFRAFDKRTGRLLWEASLPAPGYATPCTYAVGGKQYVVIAAGGGKLGSTSSDVYIAYALP
jgi:quinoprotein glucose dehydrogenase